MSGPLVIDLTGFHRVAGVCDLLRAVTFGAAVAQARGVSALSINQVPRVGCEDILVDLFALRDFTLKRWKPDDGPTEFIMDSYTSFPGIKTVSGQLSSLALQGIDPAEFLGKWKAIFPRLQPAPDIAAAVDALGVDDTCVGIHVRATDKAARKPSAVEVHAGKLPRVILQTERAASAQLSSLHLEKAYVASDHKEALGFLEQRLAERGIRVLSNRGTLFDETRMRQTSGRDFVVDLFALSRCKVLVGTINSGVPVTASLIAGRPTSDILWGRYYRGRYGLMINKYLHSLRRAWNHKAVLKGTNFCPSMAFLSV